MRRRVAPILLLSLAGLVGCPAPPATEPEAGPALAPTAAGSFWSGSLVDLTHPFDERSVYWPTAEPFVLERVAYGVSPRGYFYAANRFRAAEHGGTHLDAPIHFHERGRSVDQIPLRQLIGPGVVVDVSARCLEDRDHRVGVEDLTAWESRHGRIPPGAIVLLRTGFGRFWPDPERYLGTARRGAAAVEQLHFPGLHPRAAAWLADERAIGAVGLDTASIDHGPSADFEAHVALFERNVPAFENVANLHRLPATGFTVIALPMLIRGGSGGPLRIVGVVPEGAGAPEPAPMTAEPAPVEDDPPEETPPSNAATE